MMMASVSATSSLEACAFARRIAACITCRARDTSRAVLAEVVVTSLLAKERTIAQPGFNRWLVPPAALCIHLCIGMAYGFSVFWLPLTKAIGITSSVACGADV